MALLKLSSPWEIFYKELNILFSKDDDVSIVYDTEEQIITMYVQDGTKAVALMEILPEELHFGNIVVTLNIVPANKGRTRSMGSIYEDAFWGNPIVEDIRTYEGIMSNPITYVIFRKEVVQYWNDDIGDANGICSTLYQDIAYRVFEETQGVYFCTSMNDMTASSKIQIKDLPF